MMPGPGLRLVRLGRPDLVPEPVQHPDRPGFFVPVPMLVPPLVPVLRLGLRRPVRCPDSGRNLDCFLVPGPDPGRRTSLVRAPIDPDLCRILRPIRRPVGPRRTGLVPSDPGLSVP